MTILTVILIIVGSILSVIGVMAALAQIRTYNLLKDIVDSGAIPSMKGWDVKKKAREIIDMGYVQDKKYADSISTSLRNMKDTEANELANKVDQIVKAIPPV